MAIVRDPNFWKRFSTAVHEDELLKAELNQAGEKQTYVTTISLPDDNMNTSTPSPAQTPTSQSHLVSPTAPRFALHPQVRNSGGVPSRPRTAGAVSSPSPSPISHPHPPPRPRPHSHHYPQPLARSQSNSYPHIRTKRSSQYSQYSSLNTRPSTPPSHSAPLDTSPLTNTTTQTSTSPTRLTKAPKSHTTPGRARTRSNPFIRQTNSSQLTLGLSGRPQSRFKFWTSVSADPSNRNSWLEGQKRKKRQRAWICWGFWLVFAIIVAGVVAAVLVLKNKHII